jgi:hypothetical protein
MLEDSHEEYQVFAYERSKRTSIDTPSKSMYMHL